MTDSAKKRAAFDWFGMTQEERFRHRLAFTKKELAEDLGVAETTIHQWYKDYQKMLAEPPKKEEEDIKPIAPNGDITPEEIAQYKRLIFNIANDPKSSAKIKELCAKMLGILIE